MSDREGDGFSDRPVSRVSSARAAQPVCGGVARRIFRSVSLRLVWFGPLRTNFPVVE